MATRYCGSAIVNYDQTTLFDKDQGWIQGFVNRGRGGVNAQETYRGVGQHAPWEMLNSEGLGNAISNV